MRTESGINLLSFLQALNIRRSLFSIPIALILLTSFAFAQDNVIELTNADVLAMVKQKLPTDAIVTKIQTSRCHFDTFPTVMDELSYRGVAEEILVAMLEAPIGRPTKRAEKERAKERVTESVTTAPTDKASPGSVTVGPAEKTAAGSVSAAPTKTGSTTAAATKKATTESVKPTPKQNDATRAATPPPSEGTTAQSATSTKPAKPATDSTATKPGGTAPTTAVTPVTTEKRVSEPAKTAPLEKPKQAATSPQVLTNSDIIKLLRGGSPTSVIVTTIRTTPGNYDFSAKALLELNQAGADAAVFLSMMEVSKKTSAADNTTQGSATNEAARLQNKKPEKKKE